MKFETTLNMNKKVLAEISDAAEILNLSKSEIIVKLLKIIMKKDIDKCMIIRCVKYQKSADKSSWHKFHISLRPDDYDYFLDLRKFLKMSVSFLVAVAVRKYLREILKKDFTDNYQFKNYIVHTDIKDGYRYWNIIWGFPPNIGEFYPKIT